MSVALRLQCKPSAALRAAVLLVHAAALACAGIALPPPAFLFAAAGLLLSFAHHWRQPATARAIDWRADRLLLRGAKDAVCKARFVDGAAPNAGWAILHYEDESGRARHSLFAADCADAAAFRQLRVWLRWHPRDAACAAK